MKLPQSEVSYRFAYSGEEERCGNCNKFNARRHTCSAVDGSINPDYVCEFWRHKRYATPGHRADRERQAAKKEAGDALHKLRG